MRPDRGISPSGARQRGRRLLIKWGFVAAFLCFGLRIQAAAGQAGPEAASEDGAAGNLGEFAGTAAVSGHEGALAEKIRSLLGVLHPRTDNLGDVIVTLGSGSPRRLIVAPMDEPGYVVSGITPDGYLRLQRLPQRRLPPIFNELYSAQPVAVGTASGKWINGVVAGLSIHLRAGRAHSPDPADIENMYVDIGASSAAEVRAAGVDILSPVLIDGGMFTPGGSDMLEPSTGFSVADPNRSQRMCAGRGVGDKFGAAALTELLQEIDPAKLKGTLTVAFVVQQWTGARGLQRILRSTQADEMIYVGRMLPGGPVAGLQGVHRAPRREPGSGVLLGLERTSGTLSGFPAELHELAAANKIPFASDYSAALIPAGYLPAPAFPAKWAHLGIAAAWADTPVEMLDRADLRALVSLLAAYVAAPKVPDEPLKRAHSRGVRGPLGTPSSLVQMLSHLVATNGASGHEQPVREAVKGLLPKWAQPKTDEAGNLILHAGDPAADSRAPQILFIAHMDEIGFAVQSISNDGCLEVSLLGGMNLDFYQGHPVAIHTSTGDRWGILELPNGWDEPNFTWPATQDRALRVDVGARSPAEVAKLGIRIGNSITIPKAYRSLLGTRASARSLDDRVGCAALISAVRALGGPLRGRNVTFVWSTGEELGLHGAAALAGRLAAKGRKPDYVFAVDTFVSSDSPLESKRFADAPLGQGFVIRAVDDSNIVARNLVARVEGLARSNHIPVQAGVTGGGADDAAFVPYGVAAISLGWPLRYSHSPGEVIDTRDADALARILAVLARNW